MPAPSPLIRARGSAVVSEIGDVWAAQSEPAGNAEGSREASVTLTTDNGTQFTSTRFIETLNRLGITHRRTAYHHPEGNSYIERFHRSLKEEEVWPAEYRNVEEARVSIARWIEEYNHNRPHCGVENRTPREAFLSFAGVLKNEALTV
jgi:transposase InsO family protein